MKLNVRNIAIIELPAALLNKEKLATGDTVELNVTLDTHARAYQVPWQRQFVLGE